VNAINDHAATYLDAFFSDDPIEVSLKTFTAVKSKKKVKPSIQTEILFKGNDMKLDGLSGGECARVVVAFNLALSDIMNTPVLMLDEVTANLDADLAETIFETVSAANAQKIVMAVAHQCVDGTFQNILKF
jgi:ABC-type transport system involved in cytochrome bd biosynthesis fused ATPase/permease subunit